MPIVVDHQQRRAELVEIAIDLIVERGLDGASVRAIAARAGYSAVVVQHYFGGKSELLRLAYERVLETMEVEVQRAVAEGIGAAEVLALFLPAHPTAARAWRVFFAFWGMALSNTQFQEAQAQRGREGHDIIKRVLDACSTIPPNASGGRNRQADRLLVLIAGIASMSTFDPERWTADLQRQVLSDELASLSQA